SLQKIGLNCEFCGLACALECSAVAHFAKKRSPQKAPKVHEGTARKNVAIHGVRVRASMVKLGHQALLPCSCRSCQKADGLRRMMRLVSGDGRTSRWCTVEESSHRLWCMSVMAVRKKCDEKIG